MDEPIDCGTEWEPDDWEQDGETVSTAFLAALIGSCVLLVVALAWAVVLVLS